MKNKKIYFCTLPAVLLLGLGGWCILQSKAMQNKVGETKKSNKNNTYSNASEALRQRGIDIVNKVDFLTLNSIEQDGFPQSRVVANLHKQGKVPLVNDGKYAIYFVTNRKSAKVGQLRNNPKASAYYLDLATATWVLYTGYVDEVNDPAISKMLWSDWMKPMYGTVDNPDYMVLRLVPQTLKSYHKSQIEEGSL